MKIIENILEREEELIKRFSPLQRRLWYSFTFLMVFAGFSTTMHFLLWVNWDVIQLQKMTASLVTYFLSLLGMEAKSNGIYIVMNELGTIKIVKDCLGWKSFLALSGLIIATRKASIKLKTLSIIMGFLAVQIANLIRLVSTFYVVSIYDIGFEIVHTLLWRWGLTFLILAIWLIWLRKNKIVSF